MQVVFTGSISYTTTGTVLRNDCPENFTGTDVVFSHTETATATGSTQQEANNNALTQAKSLVDAYMSSLTGQQTAQAYANEHGKCLQQVFTGSYTATGSQDFIRNTCLDGYKGESVTYTTTITKTATASTQEKADQMAKVAAESALAQYITENGQSYVDMYGVCTKKEIIVPPIAGLPRTGAGW